MPISENKNRNQIIDIAKGIAIFLVVCGHLLSSDSIEKYFIYSFHMPAFVLLSGIFFNRSLKGDFKGFVIKRIFTLLIPYVLWSSLSWIMNCAKGLFGGEVDYLGEAIDIFIYSRSVWFLIVLFMISMVMVIIYLISDISHIPVWAIGVVVWIILFVITRHINVFCIYRVADLMPFFACGAWIGNCRNILGILSDGEGAEGRKRSVQLILFYVISSALQFSLLIWLWNEGYSMPSYLTNVTKWYVYLMYYVLGMFGIISLFALSALLSMCTYIAEKISTVGRYSIDVYLLHMFGIYVVRAMNIGSRVVLFVIALIIVAAIVVMVRFVLDRVNIYRFTVGRKRKNENN